VGGQREHPADTREAAVTGLAQAGDGLAPAEYLLKALSHPPADRVAGMAGSSAHRLPIAGWWCSAPRAASH